jgi:putative protease
MVAVRNKISKGDTVELMGPGMRNDSFTAAMTDENGTPLATANPNQRVKMLLPEGAAVNDLLRISR